MKWRLFLPFALVGAAVSAAFGEIQVIDGVKYECADGLCRRIDDDETPQVEFLPKHTVKTTQLVKPRVAQGYMNGSDFVRWLGGESNPGAGGAFAELVGGTVGAQLGLLLVILLGGLALNLTPCVLPMVPVNLILIGRSAKRGVAYGLGMACAYGALGVLAAVGGRAFGTIQANPWFNAAVAAIFVALGLSLWEVWFLDFSRFRTAVRFRVPDSLLPFFMGALSAVLAGACVAPILVSVLLLTADLFSKGHVLALGFPFLLGLGMALPWPFLGAGLKILPRPGAWMRMVNRIFGVVVFGFAVWYGALSWRGFRPVMSAERQSVTVDAFPAALAASKRPVLVDCWATWCKNCSAMERVLAEPAVADALKPFTVIRLQAEDISALRALAGFEEVRGLPAFVIFE